MIPSNRALWMWGATSLLFVAAFLVPWLAAAGAALDLVILALVVADSRAAHRTPLAGRRELPDVLHQGEAAEFALVLENGARRAVLVRVRDALAPELASIADDRAYLLPARARVRPVIRVTPARRGDVTLAAVAVRVSGPLGFGHATRNLVPGSTVRVFPQVHFGGEEGLFLRKVLETRIGTHPQARLGISTELHALREYRWGDDLRRIHWKATARLRRPIVAETTWEQHQSVVILLDCGRPMAALADGVPKLDRALAALLALLRVAVRARDRVTLVLYSREIRKIIRVDHAVASYRTVFEQLYPEQADLDEPDHRAAAAWCARHVPRRSLVMLCTSVSDALAADQLTRALRGLKVRHRAVLINVEDPGLVELAASCPGSAPAAYAKVAALAIEARNEALHAELRHSGVEVLSTPAQGLVTGAVQTYLDMKARVI